MLNLKIFFPWNGWDLLLIKSFQIQKIHEQEQPWHFYDCQSILYADGVDNFQFIQN